jgi:hypothetical protein
VKNEAVVPGGRDGDKQGDRREGEKGVLVGESGSMVEGRARQVFEEGCAEASKAAGRMLLLYP